MCWLYALLVLLIRDTNRRERSNSYVAYTKEVRFRGLVLLDASFASSK